VGDPSLSEAIGHLATCDGTEAICAQLRDNGAVIIDDFLDADLLDRFNAEIDDVLAATPEGRELSNPAYRTFFGQQTRHLSGVARHSRVFAEEVLCHPVYESVCDDILLESCVNYRLNVAHILDRGPGSEQQYLHRDEDVWAHLPKPHPTIQVASIIALEDFTAENGATRIAPGSHHWPRDRVADYPDLVAAEMHAGAAIFYLGSTIHGGGPNTTKDRRRRGMHLSFNVGWLRTEENNYLVTPLEMVRDLPRRAQQLLGYTVHDAIAIAGGSLGLYDTNDPLELIEKGEL
jgi:ectoine hydroxylase-related dioxygenase (phytanoyl-CoA dioxygenase family)